MKKLLLPLFLGVCSFSPGLEAVASQGTPQEMCLGYAVTENEGLNLGLYLHMIYEGAIQYESADMERLSGNRITKIRFKVGNELTEQNNFVFITDNLEGGPLYKQDIESLRYGWNEVTLDTPFEIDGRELFIGFRYESTGEVLSLDGEEDNNKANWIRLSQDAEGAHGIWNHQGGGALMIQAIVEGDNLPLNDIKIERHNIRSYAATQEATPMSLVVRNAGAATVNSLEVALTIDGEEQPLRTIEGLNISSNEIQKIDIGGLDMDSNNIFDVNVSIVTVNGEQDENPVDNSITVTNVISRKDYTPRKVLMEHFSTMKCANCPIAHSSIEDALRYRDNVIHVTHHAGYGTDDLTIPAAEDFLRLFTNGKTGSYYAPAASLDRVNMANYGATDGNQATQCPAFFPRREILGRLIDTRLSSPALVTICIDHTYDPSTRRLGVTVSGVVPNGSPTRLNALDPRLTVMITEDNIPGTQTGVTVPMEGPYIHNNVLRTVLSDVWGEKVDFENDTYASKEFIFTVPEEWKEENLHVIAFIHDYDPENTANWQVFNAEETDVQNSAGIGGVTSDTRLDFSLINGVLYLPEGSTELCIYSPQGTLVYKSDICNESVSMENLQRGIYVVTAKQHETFRSAKIIIK